ncbi:hypothetical protein [Stenotrophomonas bentonitica]|uniref:hypothetical protein n=1 Tax=Stenotrophomonas bentonitica TaxID=1450134 RepID=UPI00345F018F
MIPFLISRFEKPALSNLVKECFGSDFPDILGKPQIDYLYRYLKDLDAKSVLLEPEYVDRDYLDDYAKFYSRQFGNLGHRCARLHFFASELSHDLVERALAGDGPAETVDGLSESYLGFMVVRPLSRTFIGRTCLKKYPDGPLTEGRCARLSRTYKVSLFGMSLSVDTVAFQEQDKVVAACATTAIWSLLHAGRLVGLDDVPSLSRITQEAINFIPQSSNEFPNKELTTKQVLRAIDVRGFRHSVHKVTGQSREWLIKTVRSYVDSGVPALLICRVGRVDKSEDANNRSGLTILKDCGGHAITVVGLKDGIADGEAFYIHDDRMGPFARASVAKFNGYEIEGDAWLASPDTTILELRQKDGANWSPVHEVLLPTTIIAAMPRNVRVPIDAIDRLSAHLSSVVIGLMPNSGIAGPGGLRAVAALRSINEIKGWFRESTDWALFDRGSDAKSLDLDQLKVARLRFLTKNSARYQWVLDFYHGDSHFIRVLVDATDVPQGNAVSAMLYPHIAHAAVMQLAGEIERVSMGTKFDDGVAGDLYASLVRHLRHRDGGLSHHLDRSFGSLRAPKYIKVEETESSRLATNESRKVFYRRSEARLDDVFPSRGDDILIWVIDHEGSLIIGVEKRDSNIGHPALTGSKPARIAGELLRKEGGAWGVNAESGRYSREYTNAKIFRDNAIERMTEVFGHAGDKFEPLEPRSSS